MIITKYRELDAAYPALVRLAEKEMSLPVLAEFSDLLESLSEPMSAMIAERQKITAETDGADEMLARFAELADKEIEIEIKPVWIPETEEIRLSYADLTRIGGFVKIRREGTENA